MSNLITQYIRQISKFFDLKTTKPEVAQVGTNHIDDADVWTDETIYKGEIVTNLKSGKLYTSDGQQIVALNSEDAILAGMQVVSIPGASTGGVVNPLYIKISTGYVRIGGKTLYHEEVPISSPGDIQLNENTSSNCRYDLIYAYNGYPDTIGDYYKARILAITGPSDISDLYDESYIATKLAAEGLEADDVVFLGIVYVPAGYTSASVNELRPISWGVSSAGDGENLFNAIKGQPANIASVTPGFLLSYINSKITEFINADANKRYWMLALAGQVIVYNNGSTTSPDTKLYKVLQTHILKDIDTSITTGNLIQIGGSGGVGSPGSWEDNHANLLNLSYSLSGHTGFQRKTHVYVRDPEADDSVSPGVGYVTATQGDLWLNSGTDEIFMCVNDTAGSAEWVTILNTIRETSYDKNLTCIVTAADGNPASLSSVTEDPANNTYVDIKINGISVKIGNGTKLNCEAYFSNDGGSTARAISDIEAGDTVHWNGSYANYELATTDELSLFYLVNSSYFAPPGGTDIYTTLSNENLNMTAETTTSDGDLACATAIIDVPASRVMVNAGGVYFNVGAGLDCYFAAPGTPHTPRAAGEEQQGDYLYWNGSIADVELAPTDSISFIYLKYA